LRECLGIGHTVGDKLTIAFALGGLAGVAALQGHLHRAAQLWGAAEALRDVLGIGLPPADEGQFERLQVGPRFQLGDEAWRAAWAEGRALSAEAALALALEPAPEAAAMVAPLSTLPAGLSEREAEVLRLVAQGLTNAQIAERLVLSPYTVNAHLRTIFGKIGVSTRAAATRWASDNHLV
jgi:DNA-binding CsgD family transcriptional regulator